ncbi:hypothetical protein CBM2586_A10353 [Cupriavidus phytorum]|uniref:Uncharacterized protein n=1 Tax=Cupriavidus taiwanensis TaxID=164546 RepID=A0A375B9S9_9BURK|nr:hypothetical protein CBM2586_A10353 [Cupriavidus taiwanensis]
MQRLSGPLACSLSRLRERVGERAGASYEVMLVVCQRLPSPPAPLPQAGEGSKQAG